MNGRIPAKVLYIAKHVNEDGSKPSSQPTVYEQYHYDVYCELKKICENVVPTNGFDELINHPGKYDYVFSLYNQAPFRNSEILVSAVAEYYHLPYLGARPNVRAVAEDKQLAKLLAKELGMHTPQWATYEVGTSGTFDHPGFEGPYFVKPRFGAGSRGVDETSICATWTDAQSKISSLIDERRDVILEKQIRGTYYTSPVIDVHGKHLFLPCIREESDLRDGVVSHRQKRKLEGGLKRVIETDESVVSQLDQLSRKLHAHLTPLDYTRFDYVVDSGGTPWFLEFNVCCNLGKHSTLYQSAHSVGYSYSDLIRTILESSMERQGLTTKVSD